MRTALGRPLVPTLAALLLSAAPALAFKNLAVPSNSMLPTLGAGDFVTARLYGVDYAAMAAGNTLSEAASNAPQFQPKRGDVAAFQILDGTVFIKRIVGLGGDRMQMRGGRLFLNDVAVPTRTLEPVAGGCEIDGSCTFLRETLPDGASYVVEDTVSASPGDDTDTFVVPMDEVFMLGDNRDNSNDSRFGATDFGQFGTVPQSALIGRVDAVLFSPRPGPALAERLAGFPNAR